MRLGASSLERELFESYGITTISADMAIMLARREGTPVLHVGVSEIIIMPAAQASATVVYRKQDRKP